MATKKAAVKPVSKGQAAAVANFLKKGGPVPAKKAAMPKQPTPAQNPVSADDDETIEE